MVKKMEHQWRSWWRSQQYKSHYFVIKLGVSVLLVGIAFSLIYNRSSDSSTVSGDPFLENTVSTDSEEIRDQIPSKGQIFLLSFYFQTSFTMLLIFTYWFCSWKSNWQDLVKLFLDCCWNWRFIVSNCIVHV